MFEEEAEEYLKKDGTKAEQILNALNEISPLKITLKQLPFILAVLEQAFKDAAEFGYNKAKEEMQEQIEKMKCCGNCAKRGHICVAEEMQGNLCGKNKVKWELRR